MQGKKPDNQKAPLTGENIAPDPPEWLNKYAAKIWKTTLVDLEAAGRKIPLPYHETFLAYCVVAGTAREADEIISREGLTVSSGGEIKRHPATVIRNTALLQLRLYAESLGLTPGSAGRLPKPSAPARPNKFHNL
jgi:P27 family predicted phage terminase small subunit